MSQAEGSNDKPLVQVRSLAKYFDVSPPLVERVLKNKPRQTLKAVDGVSFEIKKGQTFSLVGESGCGKSTIAKLMVGLHQPSGGDIVFDGQVLKEPDDYASLRHRWQMIFQDPYASLNPRWRVRHIIAEPILEFEKNVPSAELADRVGDLLSKVGLSPLDGDKFPHEFSGGQRQRISIARALSSEPEFLVCDEPTSALDVSVQAQILNLMKHLQDTLGLTYLFISHDLAVVNHVSTHIGVMYLGRLCEVASGESLFERPRHPYTQLLLDTIPDLAMTGRIRQPVQGEVPNPIDAPSGCTFHPRCPYANDRCRRESPMLLPCDGATVACHAVEENRI